MELMNSHPLIPKRLQALKLWSECDVLHSWRPEMRTAETPRSKADVDAECERFISVLAKGYQVQPDSSPRA